MTDNWTREANVRTFASAPPNERLVRLAESEILNRGGHGLALDIGCGAARNLAPLVRLGWHVVGVDTSWPMLQAGRQRMREVSPRNALFVSAPMTLLPLRRDTFDLVIAHGVWNLAPSDAEFRKAIAEAAHATRPGGLLFVFTFSRHTLPPTAQPVAGQRYTFTDFSGEPQCFVTEHELVEELRTAGLVKDASVPLVEHNRPRPGALPVRAGPVIYEGSFRKL